VVVVAAAVAVEAVVVVVAAAAAVSNNPRHGDKMILTTPLVNKTVMNLRCPIS